MAIIKKAQSGKKLSLKDKYSNTADSLDFESRKKVYSQVNKELKNVKRSSNLDEDNKNMKQYNELAEKKFKKDPDMINSKKYRSLADKAKMKNGGSLSALKATNKRVGPVDPKGAFTEVQERTIGNMKMGGSLKKPSDDQKGLKALPTPVRNKMGYQKNGGTMKAKSGAALKKQAAIAISMKKAGKTPKKMQYGGKAASMVPPMKMGGAMMKAGGKMKKGKSC